MSLQKKVALSTLLALTAATVSYSTYRRFVARTADAARSVQPVGPVTPLAPAGAAITPNFGVETVKNSRLPGYSAKTVGEAFEGRFEGPRWESVVTPQGQKAVSFHGRVKYTVLKQAGFYIGTWNGVQQGIDNEKLIGDHKRRCVAAAGKTLTPMFDEAIIEPCMAKAYQELVVPVSFQFMMASDQKTVEMTIPDPVFQRFDADHRLRAYRSATLAFIYQ